jgi:TolB-like protein
VLPFSNLSNDPDQQYFADGITEDLTTDLSRLPNMLVIARNTAFTYKSKVVDARQIGYELGVRYLLEGSVQRSGTQVRVTTQLIDAETGTHLYAKRFDRTLDDLFALQNDVTSRIAVALNLELVVAEAARPSSNPDSLEYILRGRAAWAKPPTRDGYAEVIDLFEHALAADPVSIDAHSWLANAVTGRVLDGFSSAPAADIERAKALLETALAASPRNPFLHYIKGQISRAVAQGRFGLTPEERTARFADAIPEYEIVLAANPNNVQVLAHLAWCKFMTGAPEEAAPLLEKAIRLSPRDPYLFLWYTRLAAVHFFEGLLDEAILWLDKARRANPPFPRHIRCWPPPTASKAIRLTPPPNSPNPARRRKRATTIASGQSPSSERTPTGTHRHCTIGSSSTSSPACARPECRRNSLRPPIAALDSPLPEGRARDVGGRAQGFYEPMGVLREDTPPLHNCRGARLPLDLGRARASAGSLPLNLAESCYADVAGSWLRTGPSNRSSR